MHHFERRRGVLHAEDVSLEHIADAVGTPFYCYCAATLTRHLRVFADAFADLSPLIAYSVKAASNIAILRLLAKAGAGADVVSGGELARALRAGVPASRIVFSGVGKSAAEMRDALAASIRQFNVESEEELVALNAIARELGAVAPVAIRINPDVKAGEHDKISTGKAEDKFGVPLARARAAFALAQSLDAIAARGVALHIGSQIAGLAPFEEAFARLAGLVRELRAGGVSIDRVDLGGGLAIPYGDAPDPPSPQDYAALVRKTIEPLGVELILEPGRLIVGNAGILVARVLYDKRGEERRFLVVDAAMNDLIRPALYDAFHAIEAVRSAEPATIAYDVVGPVCESGDRFARERLLPELRPGALVAFMTAGAYSAVQSSEYNSRPLVPEVLVSGARYAVIRRRPSFEEMIARETLPDWI